MIEQFKAARKRGVPIIVARTADQIATGKAMVAAIDQMSERKFPVLVWDACDGLRGANQVGTETFKKLGVETDDTIGFVSMLTIIRKLPQSSCVIIMNAHRQLVSSEPMGTAAAVQAISNLRDAFKGNFRTLALLCPSMKVPMELDSDVVVLDDPLPGREALTVMAKALIKAGLGKDKDPEPQVLTKVVEALTGLSLFAAEQVLAMSFKAASETASGKPELDLSAVWERKRVAIEQAPGLSVHRGTETLDDVVGLDFVKARLRQRMTGKKPIGVVVMVDEIDKVFANVEHDTSGVRMDQLRTMLTEMENSRWGGIICAGLPGAGKSLLAKAMGNEAGVPTIVLDLAGMEGGIVGESEANLRRAIEVIKAVGDGNAFFIATSNNATIMRPELQRRFTGGFFFFDLMTSQERAAAWKYYIKKYELNPAQPLPEDEGWTAAEIRNCAEEAWNCNITLIEAAQYIIPVATARADEFEMMRKYASGRYLSATHPGHYQYDPQVMTKHLSSIERDSAPALSGGKRAMDLLGELADAAVASKLASMKES